jgi:hypothetical protein
VDDAPPVVSERVEAGPVWTPPSRLLAARIAGQFGLVTRSQALGAGVTRKAVACHLDSGRWIVVHPGVYLTTPGRSDWTVRAMSALLWAGAGAVLYRVSAGYAWGLVRAEPEVIEVAVPYSRLVTSRELVAVTRSRTSSARLDPLAWPHRISAPHMRSTCHLATTSTEPSRWLRERSIYDSVLPASSSRLSHCDRGSRTERCSWKP